MRRLVEAELQAEGLKDLPEDVIWGRSEQALPDVEELDRHGSGLEMLRFEGLQLVELLEPVLLEFDGNGEESVCIGLGLRELRLGLRDINVGNGSSLMAGTSSPGANEDADFQVLSDACPLNPRSTAKRGRVPGRSPPAREGRGEGHA
jgi:hypothetical protein